MRSGSVSKVSIEDLDPDLLPASTTGLDFHSHRHNPIHGARRHEQLGVDSCQKLLDATLDGLNDSTTASAILVIDANPVNGDLLEAFMAKKLGTNVPCSRLIQRQCLAVTLRLLATLWWAQPPTCNLVKNTDLRRRNDFHDQLCSYSFPDGPWPFARRLSHLRDWEHELVKRSAQTTA